MGIVSFPVPCHGNEVRGVLLPDSTADTDNWETNVLAANLSRLILFHTLHKSQVNL